MAAKNCFRDRATCPSIFSREPTIRQGLHRFYEFQFRRGTPSFFVHLSIPVASSVNQESLPALANPSKWLGSALGRTEEFRVSSAKVWELTRNRVLGKLYFCWVTVNGHRKLRPSQVMVTDTADASDSVMKNCQAEVRGNERTGF